MAKKYSKKETSVDDYDKLFNFTKVFFGNNPKYNDVTNNQKKKHRFIIQRFMAIRYPATAELFNINRINPVAVINMWKIVASKFTKTPFWIYTKTKTTINKKEKYVPSDETIAYYLKINKISRRDLSDGLKYNNEILEDLKIIEKTISDGK